MKMDLVLIFYLIYDIIYLFLMEGATNWKAILIGSR